MHILIYAKVLDQRQILDPCQAFIYTHKNFINPRDPLNWRKFFTHATDVLTQPMQFSRLNLGIWRLLLQSLKRVILRAPLNLGDRECLLKKFHK